jgi:hypothetical protein
MDLYKKAQRKSCIFRCDGFDRHRKHKGSMGTAMPGNLIIKAAMR